MFTSEPSLAQRIERMIGDLPVVDAFAHVSIKRPTVATLVELLADPQLQLELRGVGMPQILANADPATETTLAAAVPFLKRIRNTSTAWCLYRILRDLYDFLDPNLQPSNVSALEQRIAEASAEPGWADSLIADRMKLDSIMTVCVDSGPVAADRTSESLIGILDVTRLVQPLPAADKAELANPLEYDQQLATLLGDRPRDKETLRKLIFNWLDQSLTPSIKCCYLSLPSDFASTSPHDSDLSSILTHSSRGKSLTAPEQKVLAGVVCHQILAWSHEHKRAIQVRFAGSPWETQSGSGDPWFELLPTYHNARIAFMAPSTASASVAILLARTFPNAFLTLSGTELAVPSVIESDLTLAVQSVPMTKIIGFASGASSIEWVYGRLQLSRKAMAAALASLVDRRYYEEDEIPIILKQILLDTPKEFYGTSPS